MNLINFVITFYLVYVILNVSDTKDSYIAMILFPVLFSSAYTLFALDLEKDKRLADVAPAPAFLYFAPYIIGAAVGFRYHYDLLLLLIEFYETGDFLHYVMSNGATAFLLVDRFFLILASYLWCVINGGVSLGIVLISSPMLMLAGPTAHFSLLCLYRNINLYTGNKEKANKKA